MPDSETNRKRADTQWPEHKGRVKSDAQRAAAYRARKRGEPEPLPPEEAPDIQPDAEPDPADLARSVEQAVTDSVTEWARTGDPLAVIALGLARSFDKAVSSASFVPAASLADRLTSTLDRLRPTGANPAVKPGQSAKPTSPAQLIEARMARLAKQGRGA